MANPALENQVLLNRMFADTMDPFNRYFAQQLNLAVNDLQRRRQLEDEARRVMTASQVREKDQKFQLEKERMEWQRYMDVEKERTKRYEEIEDKRLKRAETLLTQRDTAAQRKLDEAQEKLDEERRGWDEAFRQLSKKREQVVEKRDKLRTISQEDRNKIARSIAAKYVGQKTASSFLPDNYKGDPAKVLSDIIKKEKDRNNALEDFGMAENTLVAMRQPEIETYERELSSIDSRLRTLDPKISPAAFGPRPGPPLPPGFGEPGAAVTPPVPVAGMSEEERMRGLLGDIGAGTTAAPVPARPASPPMMGPIPQAARYLGTAAAGAVDVGQQIGREIAGTVRPAVDALQYPISATAGGAWDRLMLGRQPMPVESYLTPATSNFVYGGRPSGYTPPAPVAQAPVPFTPYTPMPQNPALPPSVFMGASRSYPDPNAIPNATLEAQGLAQPDLVGIRDLYIGDRLRSGASADQANAEVKSMVNRLNSGDTEAIRVFQKYRERWLQKKAMRTLAPSPVTSVTIPGPVIPWGGMQ